MNNIIYYNSPLGVMRITSDADAITEIHFIDDIEKTELFTPGITIINSIQEKCIRLLDGYFSGDMSEMDISISQMGTLFQKSVWGALCNIPYGKTISYMELSKRLGNVKAIRAVGTANGRNTIAIIVPCHRVIGSNGSLVGYAGKLWRKQWLLEHEAKYAHGVQSLF